jgi:hypothetical protein
VSDRVAAPRNAKVRGRTDGDDHGAGEARESRRPPRPLHRHDDDRSGGVGLPTTDGTATLAGTVDDLFAGVARAERIAETVKGIRTVVNDIAIASAPADGTLREKVEGALP